MRLIDADALINEFDQTFLGNNPRGVIRATIEHAPTAQPERKGKWIEKEVIHEVEASTAIGEWQSAKCSVCGKYHTTPYLYYFMDDNYCPNCGAEMRPGDTE